MKKSDAASTAAASAVAAQTTAAVPFNQHPVVLAALAFAGAIATVARFPNSPVPAALVARVEDTQRELAAAINDAPPIAAAEGEGGDLAKVWETFGDLDKTLGERFGKLDEMLTERFGQIEQAVKSGLEELDQRITDEVAALNKAEIAPAEHKA